jgi:GWxTD domain-containing protein
VRIKVSYSIIITFTLIVLCLPAGSAQKRVPTNKEIDRYIKTWREKIAYYLITKEETKIFKKLKSNEEKLQFIKFFWDRRDPNPKTPKNEYRDEVLRRIGYADKAFSIGKKPGWKTPMGHLYIIFGPPSEVHPGVDAEQRRSITWTYYQTPGDVLPAHYSITFVDHSGNGDYRVVDLRYLGEVYSQWFSEQLHNPAGSPFLPPTLAQAIERVKERMILNKEMRFEPGSKTKEPILEEGGLSFDLRVDYFLTKDEKTDVLFSAAIEVKKLTYEDKEGKLLPEVELSASLSGEEGAETSERISFEIEKEELAKLSGERLTLFAKLSVSPGEYTMRFQARDNLGGKKGELERKLIVPDLTSRGLSISRVILTEHIERAIKEKKEGVSLGEHWILPRGRESFKAGSPLTIFFEVLGLVINEGTNKNTVKVSYHFYREGKLALYLPESAIAPTESSALFVVEMIPPYAFPPGDYQLLIGVEDMVAKRTFFSPRIGFTVVAE